MSSPVHAKIDGILKMKLFAFERFVDVSVLITVVDRFSVLHARKM